MSKQLEQTSNNNSISILLSLLQWNELVAETVSNVISIHSKSVDVLRLLRLICAWRTHSCWVFSVVVCLLIVFNFFPRHLESDFPDLKCVNTLWTAMSICTAFYTGGTQYKTYQLCSWIWIMWQDIGPGVWLSGQAALHVIRLALTYNIISIHLLS